MSKDLKMEVFESKEKVCPRKFFVYEFNTQKIGNGFSIIRGATCKIKNHCKIDVFEDGKRIYTTEQIKEDIPNSDFSINLIGEELLPVLNNKKIYSEYIRYEIIQKLSGVLINEKYRKYSCKSNITSKWILTERGFNTFSSSNKEISLERKYDFWIDIMDDEKAYIRIDTSSLFTSNLTVYDYMVRKMDPVGIEVKNDWATTNQTGTLVKICDFTVIDDLDFIKGGLKAYYTSRKEGYRVENLDDCTKVVKVRMKNNNQELPYYPQALKPILTREKVGEIDPRFSLQIDKYVKRDMNTRLQLDQDFLSDIGKLSSTSNLEFEKEPCSVDKLGYKKGKVETPCLVCASNKTINCGEEFKVFNYGFYRKTDKAIKIGYLYPKGEYELCKAVVNAIYSFSVQGKYHGEDDKYTLNKLLDIETTPVIKEEYELGDITDYKRAALKLKGIEDIDMVIALIPDGIDENSPYNPFKTIWAKENIPSQMISMKTAKLFKNEGSTGNSSKYYLFNIVLGILGKTGGIPWIVKDMPGNVDCFIGLDVATMDKGIHYPACSVVFDKYGRLLGFFKPSTPQKGEKIESRILQDIFDAVLISYEKKFGEYPKNIVIHRDGFSNENDEWYEKYFSLKEIEYNIIEVRKNISSKLIMIEDGNIINPPIGYCVYNNKKGYLVTTNMKNKKGSPNPLLIEKKIGNISMPDILKQVLYLSQLHVGSTNKMRLPITTGYADKICKNRDFVPEGKMDDRLFFL